MSYPRSLRGLAALWALLLPLTGLRLLPTLTAADAVLYVTALLTFAWGVGHPGLLEHLSKVLVVATGFACLAMVTTSLNAADISASALNVLKLVASLTAIYAVLRVALERTGVTEELAWAYVTGSAVLAASTWLLPSDPVTGRAIGLAGHPAEVGGLLAVAACFAVYLVPEHRWLRLTRWAVIGLLLSAFGSSLALTGVLATALGIGYVAARSAQLDTKHITTLAAVTMGGYWLTTAWSPAIYLADKLHRATDMNSSLDTNSLAARWLTIRTGWGRIQDHLIFGNGLDQAGTVAVYHLSPHNILILGWQTGGLLILIGILAIFACSVRQIWRSSTPPASPIGSALASAALATWVVAFTGPSLYQRTWMFPIILGILGASQLDPGRSQAEISPPLEPQREAPATPARARRFPARTPLVKRH